ncbi:MAG: hypothetical protein Q4E70_00280 [Candidatus Saccharibacteria bacterium]|nr:hypothetical protein [Candidatus Saccharibacteria bacterium]
MKNVIKPESTEPTIDINTEVKSLEKTSVKSLKSTNINETCETVDVNGTCYETINEALAAIDASSESTNTLTLHADIEDSETFYQFKANSTTIVDFNGYNWTTSRVFYVWGAKVELVGQGTLNLSAQIPFTLLGWNSELDSRDWTHLTVGDNVTLKSTDNERTYLITMSTTSYKDYKYSITVDMNGTLDGIRSNTSTGIFVNGLFKEGNPIFNINGMIKADWGISVSGTAMVNFNGDIRAMKEGIEMRAGELNVGSGAKIYVSSDTEYKVTPNGSGTTTEGAAIAIAQHTTKLPIEVNIIDGEFYANVPFSEANPQENDAESLAKISVDVSGGNFYSYAKTTTVTSEDFTKFISGGVYNIAPNEAYLKDGYSAYSTGNQYIVIPTTETDADDEVSDDTENKAVLGGIAEKAVAELIANLDDIEEGETFTLSDGTVLEILNIEALANALANGQKITAELVSNDVTEAVSEEEKALLYDKAYEGSTYVGIYDFSVYLKNEDGYYIAQVTELNDALKLTFDISEVPALEDGYLREYQVTRSHNGEATGLDYEISGTTMTFESDRFSNYLISYLDTEDEKYVPLVPDTSGFTKVDPVMTGTTAVAEIAGLVVVAFLSAHFARIAYTRYMRRKA